MTSFPFNQFRENSSSIAKKNCTLLLTTFPLFVGGRVLIWKKKISLVYGGGGPGAFFPQVLAEDEGEKAWPGLGKLRGWTRERTSFF